MQLLNAQNMKAVAPGTDLSSTYRFVVVQSSNDLITGISDCLVFRHHHLVEKLFSAFNLTKGAFLAGGWLSVTRLGKKPNIEFNSDFCCEEFGFDRPKTEEECAKLIDGIHDKLIELCIARDKNLTDEDMLRAHLERKQNP